MMPDQVISIVLHNRKFKVAIDSVIETAINERVPKMIETIIGNMVPRLIEVAMVRAQMEVTEALYLMASHEAANYQSNRHFTHSELLKIIGKVNHSLRQQLDQFATTELIYDDQP